MRAAIIWAIPMSAMLGLLIATPAKAQRHSTQEALERLGETLAIELEDKGLDLKTLAPAMVVSAQPAFEDTQQWYGTAAQSTLIKMFGAASLRVCEACMTPRVFVEEGRLEQSVGPISIEDIRRLDAAHRGTSTPAKVAMWLDETPDGVAFRVVDLQNGRLILAENFDSTLTARTESRKNFTRARELERRARGDSLTHTFVDVALFPRQHVSLDWTDQWGDTNQNLSGLSISFLDPVLGIGGAYYRVIPSLFNAMIGAKVLMSVPTALVRGISGENIDVIDRIITGVLVLRVPIASSNYGVCLTASTNGVFGVGISLMNVSLLPVLP